jgi:hypothetical protein
MPISWQNGKENVYSSEYLGPVPERRQSQGHHFEAVRSPVRPGRAASGPGYGGDDAHI